MHSFISPVRIISDYSYSQLMQSQVVRDIPILHLFTGATEGRVGKFIDQ